MASQAGDESLRLPAPERGMRAVALALRRPTGALGQPCVRGGLIDEDQARQCLGEEGFAPRGPVLARVPDIGAPLLAGLEGLFL